MPRTIRKRQLRNKKSRKQRGGVDQAQIDKIKKIQETIKKNIDDLLEVLGEPKNKNNNSDEHVPDQEYDNQVHKPMNMDMPTGAPPPIPDNTTTTTTTNVGEKTSNAYDN